MIQKKKDDIDRKYRALRNNKMNKRRKKTTLRWNEQRRIFNEFDDEPPYMQEELIFGKEGYC